MPYSRFYDLRYVCQPAKCGCRKRLGHRDAAPDGCAGIQEYSQMKLQMKREALAKLNRKASETGSHSDTEDLV